MTRGLSIWSSVGWLVALVSVFFVPLALDAAGGLTYFWSLTMWCLPVAYLLPLFLGITSEGTGRRRRALWASVAFIASLGIILDFLLGHAVLRFPGCETGDYALPCVPGVSGRVPVEEILFYVLGPAAIVLVYACADELWVSRYNPEDDLLNAQLIQLSGPILTTALFGGAVIGMWSVTEGRLLVYPAFLLVAALLPAMFLYRCVQSLVNWPAFALTTLYVIVTSIVWEVTLAVPRDWWGYDMAGTSGIAVQAWSHPGRPFPLEAALVWLCALYSSILTYEFAKAFTHHPQPTRRALFGQPAPAR